MRPLRIVGGNARANYNWEEVPHQDSTNDFGVEEARAYLDFGVIPNRLSVYLRNLNEPWW